MWFATLFVPKVAMPTCWLVTFYVIGFVGLALGLWALCTDDRHRVIDATKRVLLVLLIVALTVPLAADGDVIIADPCNRCFYDFPWYVCWAMGCCWLIINPCD